MTSAQKGATPAIFAATAENNERINDKYIGPKGYEKVSEKQ